MVVVQVVAVERTVTAVPVLAAVKAAVQMGTGGTEGVNSGSPVVVGVATGAAGRVARGVRNRNDASVESIGGASSGGASSGTVVVPAVVVPAVVQWWCQQRWCQ